jgi:hypothetical protein
MERFSAAVLNRIGILKDARVCEMTTLTFAPLPDQIE